MFNWLLTPAGELKSLLAQGFCFVSDETDFAATYRHTAEHAGKIARKEPVHNDQCELGLASAVSKTLLYDAGNALWDESASKQEYLVSYSGPIQLRSPKRRVV